MATPLEQLDAMRNLRPNWDGYDADPPRPEVIELAKEFVSLLAARRGADPFRDVFVAPGRAGGVLIEWADEVYEHELEVYPDGHLQLLKENKTTGEMCEQKFTDAAGYPHGVLKEILEMVAA